MRSPAEPPADGENKRRSIDAEWDAMFEASPVSSPVSDEEPTAATPEASFAGPRVAESSSADMPTGTLALDEVDPDERVAPPVPPVASDRAMVSGSWAMATRDGSSSPQSSASASASTSSGRMRDTEAEMAAIMGARARRQAAREAGEPIAPSGDDVEPPVRASSEVRESTDSFVPRESTDSFATSESTDSFVPSMRPSATEASPTPAPNGASTTPASGRPKTGPLARAPGSAARRMASSEPRRITARTAALDLGDKPRRLSLWWAVVAGIGIAGVAWLAGAPSRSKDNATTTAARTTPTPPTAGENKTPSTPSGPSALASANTTADEPTPPIEPDPRPTEPTPDPNPTPPKPLAADPVVTSPVKPPVTPPVTPPITPPVTPPTTGDRSARTPPPGTPPEIAATFVRLPVSPADRAPVAGVGSSGIHIDRVEMGAGYDNKSGCTGVANDFSLASNQEINVCVRVVHPREEEVMSIVWQKDDGTTARRGKIAVKPIHAYRTRAYLRLRSEYLGAWTVRIMSPDGVELASHAFVISP